MLIFAATWLSYEYFMGILLLIAGAAIVTAIVLTVIHRFYNVNTVNFLWMLATAIRLNRPLTDTIAELAASERGWRRYRLFRLRDRLVAGLPLPDALREKAGFFERYLVINHRSKSFRLVSLHDGSDLLPPDIVFEIKVASESGDFPRALHALALRELKRQEAAWHNTASSIFAYLNSVLLVLALITGFVCYWIIPKYKKIFEGFNSRLPDITIFAIRVADFFVNYFYLFFPVILYVTANLFVTTMRGPASVYPSPFVRIMRQFLPRLSVPLLLQQLSIAVDAGKPMQRIIAVMAGYHPLQLMRARLMVVNRAASQGHDLWRALFDTGLISQSEAALFESAQRVGNLPWALNLTADNIERRRRYRLQVLAEFLRPLALITLGVMVAIFALAFFSPLVKLLVDLS